MRLSWFVGKYTLECENFIIKVAIPIADTKQVIDYLQDGSTDCSGASSICTHIMHNILDLHGNKRKTHVNSKGEADVACSSSL